MENDLLLVVPTPTFQRDFNDPLLLRSPVVEVLRFDFGVWQTFRVERSLDVQHSAVARGV